MAYFETPANTMAGVSIWLSNARSHPRPWTACSLLQLSTFSSLLLSHSSSIPGPLDDF
jgi:hypothetical protein